MFVDLHLTYFQNEPGATYIKNAYTVTTSLIKHHDVCFNYLQRTRSAQDREDLGGGLIANFKKGHI